MGYGPDSIRISFVYKNKDFELNIPNIPCLHTFDEFKWSGAYRISIREDKYSLREIFGCYTADELRENVKTVLDKAVEEASK